jgi:hypothetical protein
MHGANLLGVIAASPGDWRPAMAAAPAMVDYPARVGIDYSDTSDRMTVFFRGFLVIPHMIVLYIYAIAAMVVLFVAWWAILFTGRMPAGMFNFLLGFQRYALRVGGYWMLLTDEFPPWDDEDAPSYPLRLEADYPQSLSRLLIFVKWLLVIPHAIIVGVYGYAAFIAVFVAWFAIMFTGQYPRGLADFVAGYLRWNARVNFYQYLMTDQYPPFDNK